jgi:Lipase (class 3)
VPYASCDADEGSQLGREPMTGRTSRIAAVGLALLTGAVLVPLSPACSQTGTEVTVREPGHRLLGPPQDLRAEAIKDVEFALLSDAAYQRTPAAGGNVPEQKVAGCPAPRVALRAAGWVMWERFPDDQLKAAIAASHLRVEVWAKRDPPSVAVAFGGTEFRNWKDWASNLRWFIPTRNDEYTQIVRRVGPEFVDEFARRASAPESAYLQNATIYSTGHSLGGGLAQQFAYALPLKAGPHRVVQVYAFDPSPVTGFYSVDKSVRDHNKVGLRIDRIYERDEILSALRSVLGVLYPPTTINPSIRAVRYNVFPTINPITGHSITELACRLSAVTQAPR